MAAVAYRIASRFPGSSSPVAPAFGGPVSVVGCKFREDTEICRIAQPELRTHNSEPTFTSSQGAHYAELRGSPEGAHCARPASGRTLREKLKLRTDNSSEAVNPQRGRQSTAKAQRRGDRGGPLSASISASSNTACAVAATFGGRCTARRTAHSASFRRASAAAHSLSVRGRSEASGASHGKPRCGSCSSAEKMQGE